MADPTTSSSQTGNGKSGVPLLLRVACGVIASGFSSWVLNWCSLHGVDFKVFGINSELVKSTIDSTLTGVFVAPECIPLAIAGVILGIRQGFQIIWRSVSQPLPPNPKE